MNIENLKYTEEKLVRTTTSVVDVYKTEPIVAPIGWKFTGEFRLPLPEEYALNKNAWVGEFLWTKKCIQEAVEDNTFSPRLILEKITPPPKKKRYIFEETGELPRTLVNGEYGLFGNCADIILWIGIGSSFSLYKPLTRKVEEF